MELSELAPGLLVAMPSITDPNFQGTVVLMLDHNDEGSLGLILNRPSEVAVQELFEAMGVLWEGCDKQRVCVGGPVRPHCGWILHDKGQLSIDEPPTQICEDVYLSSSMDACRELGGAPPDRSLVVIGYAGWGPGQLATEMSEGSWLHAEIDEKIIFETNPENMWDTVLKKMGVDGKLLASSRGVN